MQKIFATRIAGARVIARISPRSATLTGNDCVRAKRDVGKATLPLIDITLRFKGEEEWL
jgi:hypothetical protein